MIDAVDRMPRTRLEAEGWQLSTAWVGQGRPLVFIHGNATHSYMWRNIVPYLAGRYLCVAPDLPGFGSSRPRHRSMRTRAISISDHTQAVDALLERIPGGRLPVLIGHELGATVAIQVARQRQGKIGGLVLLEGVFRIANDTTFDPEVATLLGEMRGAEGERLVLEENAVIERYLPLLTARRLGPTEMAAYRKPFRRRSSRLPLLGMIRDLPLRSDPGPLGEMIEQNRIWCAQARVPKLVIGGNPGHLAPPAVLGTAARWSMTSVAAVRGLHFLAEDSPARVAGLLLDWLADLPR